MKAQKIKMYGLLKSILVLVFAVMMIAFYLIII
jgi:hypothetical protein